MTTARAQKTSWGPDASQVIVQGHNHCIETPSWEREYKEGGEKPWETEELPSSQCVKQEGNNTFTWQI